jgi:hypothetical protein
MVGIHVVGGLEHSKQLDASMLSSLSQETWGAQGVKGRPELEAMIMTLAVTSFALYMAGAEPRTD